MKTKLIILAMFLAMFAGAQTNLPLSYLDTTTIHTSGGQTYPGDNRIVGWTKINTSITNLWLFLCTNGFGGTNVVIVTGSTNVIMGGVLAGNSTNAYFSYAGISNILFVVTNAGITAGGGFVTNVIVGNVSNFYQTNINFTTNVSLTTNINNYVTNITWTTNYIGGTNIFNNTNYTYNTNIYYISYPTNYNTYISGGGATNAINNLNGVGTNTTIYNPLTLVNTNTILGYTYEQIVTISTNALGVVSTNTFILNTNTGFLTASNGLLLIPYYFNVFLPVQGSTPNGDGSWTPTNTSIPPQTGGTITISWSAQTNSGPGLQMYDWGSGTATYNGSTWSHTGTDAGVTASPVSGSSWVVNQSVPLPPNPNFWEGASFSVNTPFNGSYQANANGYSLTGDLGYIGGTFTATIAFSGFPDQYSGVPPGFVPVIPIGQTVPLWITNMEYIVLQAVTNNCGYVTNYNVIGWNPYGNTMNGWQIYTNSLHYAPPAPPECSAITTNFIVFHQQVWVPDICFVPNTINVNDWNAGINVASQGVALQGSLVNFGAPAIGVNLNQNKYATWFGVNLSSQFSTFWLNYYGLGNIISNGVVLAASPAASYATEPTTGQEPAINSYTGSYWQPTFTNITALSTNYTYFFTIPGASGGRPPIAAPNAAVLSSLLPAVAPTTSTNYSTNQFIITRTTNNIAVPVFASTVLQAHGDSTLGINSGTPVTSYSGLLYANQLDATVYSLISNTAYLMASNMVFQSTNGHW